MEGMMVIMVDDTVMARMAMVMVLMLDGDNPDD